MKNQTIPSIIISRLTGFVIFLVLLIFANIFAGFIPSPAFGAFIAFINVNILLFALIAILFACGEVFAMMEYPASIVSVLFNAAGAIFILLFMFRLISYFDSLAGTAISPVVDKFALVFIIIVALIIIIAGLFPGSSYCHRKKKETGPVMGAEDPGYKTGTDEPGEKWEDVGLEFRRMLIRWFRGH